MRFRAGAVFGHFILYARIAMTEYLIYILPTRSAHKEFEFYANTTFCSAYKFLFGSARERCVSRGEMDECGDCSISRRCRALVGRRCDETSNYLDMFPHENKRHGRCLDFFRMRSAKLCSYYPSVMKTVIATDASSRDI